jgi:hypothetical protein
MDRFSKGNDHVCGITMVIQSNSFEIDYFGQNFQNIYSEFLLNFCLKNLT